MPEEVKETANSGESREPGKKQRDLSGPRKERWLKFIGFLCIFLLALLAIFWLVKGVFMRRGATEAEVAEEQKTLEEVKPLLGNLHLLVESPIAPSKFYLFRAEEVLCEAEEPGQIFNIDIQNFELPPDGLELRFRVEWSEHLPGPRAMRVVASLGEVNLSEAVFWGEGEILEACWWLRLRND
ncbi:MAG: hypothetical protein N2035_06350 [Chthoniobacterales bacterium]|nr:hypothetical protein [Chthoniobacterales bacterium]